METHGILFKGSAETYNSTWRGSMEVEVLKGMEQLFRLTIEFKEMQLLI